MADRENRGFTGPEFGSRAKESTASGTMGAVKDKAQEFASDVAGKAGDAWETTKQTASDAWETTRHTAQDYAGTAMNRAEEAFDSFGGFVRRYPVASVLCALGVGFLMAGGMQCMMSNRRD